MEIQDCNNCKHCSPKEYEQTRDKEPHMCKATGKILKHGTNSKSHYAIQPLSDCPYKRNFVDNAIKSKNVIDIESFQIGSVYSIWNGDGEIIFTGMLMDLQATYMQFLQPSQDGKYDACYYVYYQDIELRGTKFELKKKFSEWFYESVHFVGVTK